MFLHHVNDIMFIRHVNKIKHNLKHNIYAGMEVISFIPS